MANSHWKSPVSGSFNLATNWNPSGVPGVSSFVSLDATGAAYTVTSSQNNTISWLAVLAPATFDIASGVFNVHNVVAGDTWSNIENTGVIDIGTGASLAMGQVSSPSNFSSTIFNSGSINLSSGAALKFNAPWNGLEPGAGGKAGAITMTGSAQIIAGTSFAELENYDNTISGAGTIGSGNLFLQNDKLGTIDANGGALTLESFGHTIYNTGLIEATGAGNLNIVGPGNSSSTVAMFEDGTLKADGTGVVTLVNSFVQGGGDVSAAISGSSIALHNSTLSVGATLSTVAGSSIVAQAGTSDTIFAANFQNAGTLVVSNGATLSANSTIFNSGKVDVGSGIGAATMKVLAPGLTFDGTGQVVLTDNAANAIVGDGADGTLNNSSNFSGAGTIGDFFLRFVNLTGAVVNANGANALTIVGDGDLANEKSAFNSGLMETSGAGGMTISGTWGDAGTIEAAGAGALTLLNATINSGGGLVETTTAGAKIVLDNGVVQSARVSITKGSSLTTVAGTLNGFEDGLTNAGAITIANGSTLISAGHWVNSGSVALAGTTTATKMEISGEFFRLLGGGTLNMTSSQDSIVSNGSLADFRNINNTIQGVGAIGDANLTLSNEADGKIIANGATALTINTGANQVNNYGVIESNSAVGISIDSNLLNSGFLIANKGTIFAQDNVTGAGLSEINGAGEIEFGAGGGGNPVIFGAGADGTLRLDHSSTAGDAFFGSISGFTGSDKIDFSDIGFVASGTGQTTLAYSGDTIAGTLTITQGAHTSSLFMLGDYTLSSFHLSTDSHGGTLVT